MRKTLLSPGTRLAQNNFELGTYTGLESLHKSLKFTNGSLVPRRKQRFAHCSTNYAFSALCVSHPTCSKLPATTTPFPVLCHGYAHPQLQCIVSLPLAIFGTFHMRKNTRLSKPAQLQCLRSSAWEAGNEASSIGQEGQCA